jgi:ArsR family transcriptional regulator, lead/cadmium/zinc/bismuth-responsive transcriptional repressor
VADDRCDLLCLDLPRAEALRECRPTGAAAREAADRAAALGDPTRLTIAVALREGRELCVCDLAWVAERSENLVGHHLKALRTAGLATSRREQKMVFYSLTPSGSELLRSVLEPAEALS